MLIVVPDTRLDGYSRIGWRITCQNGDLYDVFWGLAKTVRVPDVIAQERLRRATFADAMVANAEFTVTHLQPDEVRDKHYYKFEDTDPFNLKIMPLP